MDTERALHLYAELKQVGKKRFDELKALGSQLFEHISPRDLATLLFPPALGLDLLAGNLAGRQFERPVYNPDDRDPEMMVAVLAMARWWQNHYFTTSIEGAKQVPSDTPVMIVGNHSAGLLPLDALFAMNALLDAGCDRPVYPLVHDFAYIAPRVAQVAKRAGVVRASRENAAAVLADKQHLLVYPGGDKDAFRTFKDRKKVVLAGRKGFIRTALLAGVPIVPLVSVGLHESFMVLSTGEKAADKLKLKKFLRTEIFPLALSFPYGLVPAFFPFIPLPTAIDMVFCAPMHFTGSPDDDQLVDRIYDEVEQTMQTTMDQLYQNRVPLLGRPK